MATPKEKKDVYVLLATLTGNKGFRKGDELRVAFVPDIPKNVECVGPSADRKRRVVKFVRVKELAGSAHRAKNQGPRQNTHGPGARPGAHPGPTRPALAVPCGVMYVT